MKSVISFLAIGAICTGISSVYGKSILNPDAIPQESSYSDGSVEHQKLFEAAESMMKGTYDLMKKTVDKLKNIEKSIGQNDFQMPEFENFDKFLEEDGGFAIKMQNGLAKGTVDLENIKNHTSKDVKKRNTSSSNPNHAFRSINSHILEETSKSTINHGDNRKRKYAAAAPSSNEDKSRTRVNERGIAQRRSSSNLVTIDPDTELIDNREKTEINRNVANDIDQRTYDLSGDTLVNDIMARKQATLGVVTVDPDAELIDVQNLRQQQQQRPKAVAYEKPRRDLSKDTANSNYMVVRLPAAEEEEDFQSNDNRNYYSIPVGNDEQLPRDLSGDIEVNNRLAQQMQNSGKIVFDPDAELINVGGTGGAAGGDRFNVNNDYYRYAIDEQRQPQRQHHYHQEAPGGIDLSGDILVNERIAQQQAASGLVTIHPDAELIDVDLNANKNNNFYYRYVPVDDNIDGVERSKRNGQPIRNTRIRDDRTYLTRTRPAVSPYQ